MYRMRFLTAIVFYKNNRLLRQLLTHLTLINAKYKCLTVLPPNFAFKLKTTTMLRYFFLAATILFSTLGAFSQTSGEIEYEITRQISPDQMRRFGGGAGGDESSPMPSVITLNQIMKFNGTMGTVSMPRPGQQMGGMMMQGSQMRRFMPFDSKDFVDLANGKYLHYLRATSGEDTTTWYLNEEPFESPTDWKVEKKTKKILGYECKKATATLKNTTYTIWYTTDIKGLKFSPLNGLFPAEGVILALESDEQAYIAKKIDLSTAIPTEDVTPNYPEAKSISADELRTMRREAGERMRAQFQQMQRQ
jgi:GLPGLI family protein